MSHGRPLSEPGFANSTDSNPELTLLLDCCLGERELPAPFNQGEKFIFRPGTHCTAEPSSCPPSRGRGKEQGGQGMFTYGGPMGWQAKVNRSAQPPRAGLLWAIG